MNGAFKDALSRGALRVECSCELEFNGPLHVGTGEALSLVTDAPLLRDGDGNVWLPGSSVRGVLADWCQREAPLLGVDRDSVHRLFGVTPARGAGASQQDWQGRLTVLDVALNVTADSHVRDHVRIDRRWGAAAEGGKFDQEIAYACSGTFRLVYDGDGHDDPELVLLRSAVDAMRKGLLAFGGKTGWGLGAVRAATAEATWSCVNRAEPQGMSAYLASKLPTTTGGHSSTAPTEMRAPPTIPDSACRPRERDEPAPYSWLCLDVSLAFDGPMLIAAIDTNDPSDTSCAAEIRREADAVWQTRPDGEPVLTGSALRGPLRSIADRIVKTLGIDDLSATLFGTVKATGLLRVEEGHLIDDAKLVVLNHVAIDRVTGFAATNRLFDTASLASPRFRSRLLVRWNHDDDRQRQAVALLLFVLRDSAERGLWIGSRTTRGYGYVKGVVIENAAWSLVVDCENGEPPKACGRQPECSSERPTVSRLGADLGFVEAAWRNALASRSTVRNQ